MIHTDHRFSAVVAITLLATLGITCCQVESADKSVIEQAVGISPAESSLLRSSLQTADKLYSNVQMEVSCKESSGIVNMRYWAARHFGEEYLRVERIEAGSLGKVRFEIVRPGATLAGYVNSTNEVPGTVTFLDSMLGTSSIFPQPYYRPISSTSGIGPSTIEQRLFEKEAYIDDYQDCKWTNQGDHYVLSFTERYKDSQWKPTNNTFSFFRTQDQFAIRSITLESIEQIGGTSQPKVSKDFEYSNLATLSLSRITFSKNGISEIYNVTQINFGPPPLSEFDPKVYRIEYRGASSPVWPRILGVLGSILLFSGFLLFYYRRRVNAN